MYSFLVTIQRYIPIDALLMYKVMHKINLYGSIYTIYYIYYIIINKQSHY